MGRPRKHNRHLPPRMQLKRGTYYHTPYIDGRVRWRSLGRNYGEALRQWAELEGEREHKGEMVADAIDRYLIDVLPTKAKRTQPEYRRNAGKLREVFDGITLAEVRPSLVARYLDSADSKVSANRQIALLSAIYQQAIRWGWVETNPCRGVSRNPEQASDAIPSRDDIARLLEHAGPQMQVIIRLAIATGLRRSDILALRLSQITDDGLLVQTSKTGAKLLFERTSDMDAILGDAKKLRRRVTSAVYVFVNRDGQPYTDSGFSSLWQALQKRAGVRVKFHGLRAVALTEAAREGGARAAQSLGAHKSVQTTEIYLRHRLPQRVKPVKF